MEAANCNSLNDSGGYVAPTTASGRYTYSNAHSLHHESKTKIIDIRWHFLREDIFKSIYKYKYVERYSMIANNLNNSITNEMYIFCITKIDFFSLGMLGIEKASNLSGLVFGNTVQQHELSTMPPVFFLVFDLSVTNVK